MSDRKSGGLPFGGGSDAENTLWKVLGEANPLAEPTPRLRRNFYSRLEQASRPGPLTRVRDFLGFGSNAGWVTAAACLLAGLAAGQLVGSSVETDGQRLATLEQNVALLNRSLVLDRLENDEPGKRLRGVLDAANLVAGDERIARQLLAVATGDRVDSIRSAAVESLGSSVRSPEIGGPLIETLQETESPLVQLALVDLLLRHGSDEQLDQLLEISDDGSLQPDLTRHVYTSLGRNTT